MGNGGEPVRTQEKCVDLGGSKGGTDSNGYEKEKAGVVWPRQKKRRNREHQSSCRNEDGGKRPRGRPKLRWKDTVRRDVKA